MRIPGFPSCLLLVLLFSANGFAQITSANQPITSASQPNDSLESISANVARMTTAVETLNKNWYTFFKTLTSDKGGEYFTDRQKRLLFTLEVLNRYEKSLATAQELRLTLIERQTKLRLQLATITDDLRPESIDRFTAWRGTTDAEGVRDIRRTALQREHRELTTTLAAIGGELQQSAGEIRQMEQQIRTLRSRIFGEIDRETANP